MDGPILWTTNSHRRKRNLGIIIPAAPNSSEKQLNPLNCSLFSNINKSDYFVCDSLCRVHFAELLECQSPYPLVRCLDRRYQVETKTKTKTCLVCNWGDLQLLQHQLIVVEPMTMMMMMLMTNVEAVAVGWFWHRANSRSLEIKQLRHHIKFHSSFRGKSFTHFCNIHTKTVRLQETKSAGGFK